MQFYNYKPIRLIELFAGVGSQAMALRDIGANFEHYRVVEFDKYPVASYNAIHRTNFSTMDVTKIKGADLGIVDTDHYTYLLTYSFPCQDLSTAGKGAGMTKGSGTRSGLLWEVERLLNETESLPQILVMENVPQVHSKKNLPDFQKWLDYLKFRGYTTYWRDLSATDYGVAQSRKRCFAISILGDYKFEFPSTIPLETSMKDYLEDSVDEKYYIASDKAKLLIDKLLLEGKIHFSTNNTAIAYNCSTSDETRKPDGKPTDIACTLQARDFKGLCNYGSNVVIKSIPVKTSPIARNGKFLGSLYGHGAGYAGACWDSEGVAPTLTTMQGGGRQPIIADVSVADGVPSKWERFIYNIEDETFLIRLRKLTPRECWRLMDFTDEDYDKAASVVSNSQLYKQAGNSIVKGVLEAIFKSLFMSVKTRSEYLDELLGDGV